MPRLVLNVNLTELVISNDMLLHYFYPLRVLVSPSDSH